MARVYTVEGRPEVIAPHQLNLNFLSQQGAYIVEIKITKVNKHYPLPLIVRKVNCLNLNDDNLNEGETINTTTTILSTSSTNGKFYYTNANCGKVCTISINCSQYQSMPESRH